LSCRQAEDRYGQFLHEDRARGFDLLEAPLMRVALLKTADDAWRCVWTHHHLVLDGWSVGLVLRDLLGAYPALLAGRQPSFQACPPYRDYIAWLQRQDLAGADAFWRQTLGGLSAPTPLGLAQTGVPPSVVEHSHGERLLRLEESLTTRLQTFARQHQLTLSTLVAGAWALCLARYSDQQEVVFGLTVSGRPADLAGVGDMVGMFINTLPLRVAVPDDQPVVDWLRELQARQAEVTPYAFTPLVRIQQQSAVPAGQPLFESILVFENYPVDESLAQAPAGLRVENLRGMEQTNYPLSLYAMPGRQLTLRMGYDRRRIDPAVAEETMDHLHTALTGMIASPRARLADVPILSAAQRQRILQTFNDTAVDVPANLQIHQLFEAQVQRTPDAVAAVSQGQACTYTELNRRANCVARHLRSLGVGPEVLVGICLDRSTDMLSAVLGVLKAGGAYVPLDPAFPPQRLLMMVEDAAPRVILTQRDLSGTLPASTAVVVSMDELPVDGDADDIAVAGNAVDVAYAIFTSGSTGRPKGVVVEHRNVVNFLVSMARRPGLNASDVLVAVTTLSFDIAGLELLLPLTVGACVVVATGEQAADPVQLRQLLDDSGATVMQATPATWRMLLESGWTGRSGLRMLCGGEALSRDLADRLLAAGDELWNLYGPTETTIWSSVHRIQPEQGPISIGKPIGNTRMYILDRRGEPVTMGATGELFIAGAGVARGYFARPDLTAERFPLDAFSNQPSNRMYRTGDLARYCGDGTIECLGRIDHQVKIRGFRIELGEIESALAQHPAVRQAVVIDRDDSPGEKRLVAYWLAADGQAAADEELRQYLRSRLPEYMVPSAFVRLDAFPLTPNGKIDRRALPSPDSGRQGTSHEYLAPRDEHEQSLAEIWSKLLNRTPIGANDNFFELGGHSLLATRLALQIRDRFAVNLPIRAVFDRPTLAGLADHVRTSVRVDTASIAISQDVEEGQI
jgi:amino acid adenylation domain-containing protein